MKIMFVSSSGGHYTQLMMLKQLMENNETVILTEQNAISKKSKYRTKFLPYMNRKKKFDFCKKIIPLIAKSIYYVIKENPKIIVTTGAGLSVPICYIGKLLGKKIIFIESFARRDSKSLSGKYVYPISNVFVVQWEDMLKIYPKAKYLGEIY